MKGSIAIIDLGTNTFHLLVARQENGKTTILHREKQAVKLGLAGINQGMITPEAIQRALTCLKKFKGTMQELKVESVQAIGTSALRSAANGKEVIDKIKSETGVEVRLISGDEEAEYIYYGIRSALDLGLEKSLIVDIGGGSVEFIIGNRDSLFWKQSFEIGAQRLLEMHHRQDPIRKEDVKNLDAYFKETLSPLLQAVNKFLPTCLVGSSGTFDTLSEIYCLRNQITISPDHSETPLTVAAFFEIHKELISKNRAERSQIPGMIEMRVDMIVVASCLVKYLLDTFTFQRIRVSSYSLKEGVLAKEGIGYSKK